VHSWWAPAHVLLAKSHDQAAFTFQSSGHPESIGDIHAIRVNPVSTATLPHVSSSAWRAVTAAAAAPAGEAAATQAAVAVTAPAVALDVEYAHYTTADGRHISVPAWVAVVDQHCTVLLKTFIRHQVSSSRVHDLWCFQAIIATAPVGDVYVTFWCVHDHPEGMPAGSNPLSVCPDVVHPGLVCIEGTQQALLPFRKH
jgi:hypothetical protein